MGRATGRKRANGASGVEIKDVTFATAGQTYAVVVKLLGDRRLLAKGANNEDLMCRIANCVRRRWVNVNDIVLVSIREFQPGKGDVIEKYEAAQVRLLRKSGEHLPDANAGGTVSNNDDNELNGDKLSFDFDDEIDLDGL